MARRYTNLGDRIVYNASTGLIKAQGAAVTIYRNAALTQLANLAYYDPTDADVPGSDVQGAVLLVDAYSLRQGFWDLDDLDVLYMVGGSGGGTGPAVPIYPDPQPQIAELATAVAAAGEDVADALSAAQAASASVAGLGDAAALDVGTTADSVAAGNAPAAAQAAAISRAVRPGLGNRFAFLGDSTTLGYTGTTEPITTQNQDKLGQAWPTLAALLSQGRIRHVVNAGVGGTKTDSMLARIDQYVTPYAPTAVSILAGTNDIDENPNWESVTLPGYKANMQAIVAKILAMGATPIICTVIPNTSGGTTRRVRTQQVNQWLRWYAASNGFPLVDFHRALVDPANGQFAAGMSTDGLHQTAAAHLICAQTFIDAVLPLVPPDNSMLPDDTHNNLLQGLFLTDTAGIPAGWSAFGAGGTLMNSVTTDAAVLGRVAQVDCTDTATARGLLVQVSSGWAVGDRIAFCGKVKYTYGGTGPGVTCRLNAFGGSREATPVSAIPTTFGWGSFYKELTIPASTTRLDAYLICTQGTAQFAQVGLYNLTALAVPNSGSVPLT